MHRGHRKNFRTKDNRFSRKGLEHEDFNRSRRDKIRGHGFLEVVYKDALEIEFRAASIFYEREAKYEIDYKGQLLPHYYFADFVVFGKVILEVKCCKTLTDEHIAQTINYLKVSGCKLGLLVNFARGSLEYKRLVY